MIGIRQQVGEVRKWLLAKYGTTDRGSDLQISTFIRERWPDLLPVQREQIMNGVRTGRSPAAILRFEKVSN